MTKERPFLGTFMNTDKFKYPPNMCITNMSIEHNIQCTYVRISHHSQKERMNSLQRLVRLIDLCQQTIFCTITLNIDVIDIFKLTNLTCFFGFGNNNDSW